MQTAHWTATTAVVGMLAAASLLAPRVTAAAEAGAGAYWDAGHSRAPVVLDLPDPGPHLEDLPDLSSIPAFSRALEDFRRRRLPAAIRGFRALAAEAGHGAVADAARALLAEALVLSEPGPQGYLQAIELYRALTLDSHDSPNGVRAMWREGDLYAALGMYVEAKASYERAAGAGTADWHRHRALLGMGVTYLRWGKWREAALVFETLRRAPGPFGGAATVGLAEALYARKRFAEARPIYEAGYRLWPVLFKAYPALLLNFADAQRLDHQSIAARRLYAEVYNLHPKSEEAGVALVRLGDALREDGHWNRAAMFYADAARRFAPGQAGAVGRMRLAQLGRELNDVAHARPGGPVSFVAWPPVSVDARPMIDAGAQQRVIAEIAARYEDAVLGSEARFHLGELAESRHDRLEAVRHYEEVAQRQGRFADDPWPERALQRLAVVMLPWIERALRRGDDLTAVALYRESRGRAQDALADGALLLPLADAHRRLGVDAEAIKLYQMLLQDRLSPFREDALIGLGWCYLAQDDYAAARRVFERYRLQHPLGRWTSEAIRSLAFTFDKLGDRAAAIRTLRHWLQTFPAPTHPERGAVLVALAKALADAGDLGEAVRVYEQAAATPAGRSPESMIHRADLLARLNRTEAAARLYARGANAAEDGAEAQWAGLQLGRMRRLQHRYDEARAVLDEVAQRAGDELMGRLAAAMKHDLPDED